MPAGAKAAADAFTRSGPIVLTKFPEEFVMPVHTRAIAVLAIGLLTAAAPAIADSVAVASGPDGTAIVNGQPCRVITRADAGSNSTSITTGPDGLTGTTTISPGGGSSVTISRGSPGGSGSSVAVGSSASSNGQSSATAGSNCVIYRNKK